MKRHQSGWTTMIGFIAALVALLLGACFNSRTAWSFSADVPSPLLASITGGAPPSSTAPPPATTTSGGPSGPGAANPGAPGGSNPENTPTQTAATTSGGAAETENAPRTGSKWPAIILGSVIVVGGILIVLYFVTRNNDD